MRGGWRAGVAALAAALALAGCGGGGSDSATAGGATTTAASTATTATGFCASLASLQRAAGDFRNLDPASTTADRLALYAANLGSAWQRVQASLGDASGADTTALEAAWQKVLSDAKRVTSSGASAQAAGATLKTDAAALAREADALAPNCPPG